MLQKSLKHWYFLPFVSVNAKKKKCSLTDVSYPACLRTKTKRTAATFVLYCISTKRTFFRVLSWKCSFKINILKANTLVLNPDMN